MVAQEVDLIVSEFDLMVIEVDSVTEVNLMVARFDVMVAEVDLGNNDGGRV